MKLIGLEYEYRWVDVLKPLAERRKDFRAASAYGEMPVLVVDGQTLAQSDAILLHLARTTGKLGGDQPDLIAQWLFREANRIGLSLPNLRWEHHFMGAADGGLLDWLRKRLEADLAALERALEDRPFLLGQSISVADIAHAAYLWFADQARLDLAPYPDILAWMGRIESSPAGSTPTG
jgi:glutathione S-transferase